MFTGIIEEIGAIKSKTSFGNGIRFMVSAKEVLQDIHIGDSISVNGVCQTVVQFDSESFTVEAIDETLKKTTFGYLKPGDNVNLERALLVSARLGGHFVLGHVDCFGKIEKINRLTSSNEVTVSFPEEYTPLIIPIGSVAVDGISLTVAEVHENQFMVAIIPHTWEKTILSGKSTGDVVNLEFDILGKYIVQLNSKNQKSSKITEEWLTSLGY